MARRARRVLARALEACTRGDGAFGRDACCADVHVDALHDSVFRTLLIHMTADARTIIPSLELPLVSRTLERVAPLATKIGEDAVFLAKGTHIEHRNEERAEAASTGAGARR